MNSRLVAIEGGGDWADASVHYLRVPSEVAIQGAKLVWREWYDKTYIPALRAYGAGHALCPSYTDLSEFLAARFSACSASATDIEVFCDE